MWAVSLSELFWSHGVRLSVRLSVNFPQFHLLQNNWTISTKLSTKHHWVKRIPVCLNQGSRPFPRGDNNEVDKIHWRYFKFFFFRTAGPISVKRQKAFFCEDLALSQGVIITKYRKYNDKIYSSPDHWAISTKLGTKHSVEDSSQFKLRPLHFLRGNN